MDWLVRTSGGFVSCALASAGVLIGGVAPAFSHHPSGASSSLASGPIITIPGITLEKGAGAVVFAFEHISFDELSDAALEAAAARHEHAHSLGSIESPSLGFAYGVTDRLMFSLLLPYVLRTDIREAHHHHHEDGEVENETVDRGDTEGIGDLTLLGQYQFLGQGAELQASLLAGLKAPTGETGERDAEGELFETEFQPGSGSWDGLIGVAVSRPIGKWSLDGNVLYTIATEGAEQTDLGDRFNYNGALSYRVWGGAEGSASTFTQVTSTFTQVMRIMPMVWPWISCSSLMASGRPSRLSIAKLIRTPAAMSSTFPRG